MLIRFNFTCYKLQIRRYHNFFEVHFLIFFFYVFPSLDPTLDFNHFILVWRKSSGVGIIEKDLYEQKFQNKEIQEIQYKIKRRHNFFSGLFLESLFFFKFIIFKLVFHKIQEPLKMNKLIMINVFAY